MNLGDPGLQLQDFSPDTPLARVAGTQGVPVFTKPQWVPDGAEEELATPSGLMWWPSEGYGFLPLDIADDPMEYGQAYWDHYQGLVGSATEKYLNDVRLELVQKWQTQGGMVLDVGIGNGSFLGRIQLHGILGAGYDVNPLGVEWLRERGIYVDLLGGDTLHFESVTFWDVLEHIPDAAHILARAHRFVFISMPIYTDASYVLRSKHFKPGEHCWYFTEVGLVRFMAHHGFELVDMNKAETFAGREGIGSFVFERSGPGK